MLGQFSLIDFLSSGRRVEAHRPWPRFVLDDAGWRRLTHQLGVSDWVVLGLWADAAEVHVALHDEELGEVAVASMPVAERRAFASLTAIRPGVLRLERAVQDLYGYVPLGLVDQRPWLDHGRWPRRAPLSNSRTPPSVEPYRYKFLPVEGEGLHQIPVGPVHAGIIEPGHFRFTCQGETVVRLEQRLGYQHKGIESLMAGKPIDQAARLAGRISGDSTVAYAIAFARAVEAASSMEAPPRAVYLRAIMAELERIANHVFDFGAVCNDAAAALVLAEAATLRERILHSNLEMFGHRLMMDRVVPGGVTVDLSPGQAKALFNLVTMVRAKAETLFALYDNMPSLLDRTTGTGVVSASLAHRFGAGGFVGRGSARGFDCRKTPGYAPYDDLDFEVPIHPSGDVHARLMIRQDEIRASLGLIEQLLDRLPAGPLQNPVPTRGGEGMALVEAFRGDLLIWLRLSEVGRVVRCHARDASWFQWPLLEACIEGNIVADFPLCNKSFNCSYSGQDM